MRTGLLYKGTLLAICLLCTHLLTSCQKSQVERRQINVVFRMDDYSARSATDMELRVIDLFRKKDLSITFGVIPFVWAGNLNDPSPKDFLPLPLEKGDILRAGIEEGVLDVALHGYSHQTINENEQSEFAGLDYPSQVERLAKGKQLLEGMIGAPVTTFAPPWNRYDLNTLMALEEMDFTTLSAGWNGAATKESKIRFMPATCSLPMLRDAVDAARTSSDEQPLIVVLFHLYDFREINAKHGVTTFQEVSDLLDWLKSQRDIRLMSIGQAAEVIQDLSVNRFLMVERWRSLDMFLPSILREKKPVLLYHEASVFPKTLLKVGIFYGIIALLFAGAAFSVGFWLLSKSEVAAKTATFGCVLATAGVIVYTFRDLEVSPQGMMAVCAAIGACAGLLCEYLLRKWFRARSAVGERYAR